MGAVPALIRFVCLKSAVLWSSHSCDSKRSCGLCVPSCVPGGEQGSMTCAFVSSADAYLHWALTLRFMTNEAHMSAAV